MVALGGRARTTSRGDSLGSLVQTGKTRASVSLTLHVPSKHRQIYQKYGDTVTVIRIIKSKGSPSSQYKLKDSQDRLVEESNAQAVKNICQYFGFYPDNELAMLSQENAKEFLVSATPRVKYEKLRQALLQNMIDRDRSLVISHEKELESFIERVGIYEKSALEKQAKADEILKRATLQASGSAKMKAIELIMAWREANKVKQQLQKAQDQQNEQEIRLGELERRLNVDTRRAEVEQRKTILTEERNTQSDLLGELENKYAQLVRAVAHSTEVHKETKQEIEDLKTQADKCEENIAKIEHDAAELTPEVVARRKAEIERELSEAKKRRSEAATATMEAEMSVNRVKETLEKQRDQVRHLKERANEVQQRWRALQTEEREVVRGDSTASNTPPNIRSLQQLVERQQWTQKPIGPLYQFVQMRDDGADFAPALERLWSSTLEGWWVETDEDRRKLLRLAETCNIRNLRIFKRKDDPFDFSSALPRKSSEYVRAVDVIDAVSDQILRLLVDFNHIENLVLVQGTDAAFKVTDAKNGPNPVKMALSMSISGVRRRFVTVSTPGGRLESATLAPMDRARMKVGMKARLRQLQIELQEKKEELSSAQRHVQEAEKSMRVVEQKSDECSRALRKAYSQQRRSDDDINTCEASLFELNTQVTALDANEELKNALGKLKDLKEQIQEGYEALQEQEDERTENQNELQDIGTSLKNAKDRMHEIEKELRRVNRELENMEEMSLQYRNRFDRELVKRDEAAARIRTIRVDYDEKIEVARSLGPDPNEIPEPEIASHDFDLKSLLGESSHALNSELSRLKGQQQVIEAAEVDVRSAQKLKEEASKEILNVQRDKAETSRSREEIQARQKMRDENYTRSWNAIKFQISSKFANTLTRRSFVGSVEIDDKGSKLLTHVTPGDDSNRPTLTLSGGEKSYTQAALVMAVWSAMHVGFVAMDEYDVFMDKPNRTLSLRLLSELVESKNIQCILITPQTIDTKALKGIRHKIHELAAARG